jgi:cyanate permease
MRLEATKRAVAATFLLNGFAFASWLSRLPSIRDSLELSTAGVGVLLVCVSVGTLLALPLSGWIVTHAGAATTVWAAAATAGLGLATMAVGVGAGSAVWTGVGMFAYGVGTSVWDVAMNVEGVAVERRLARSVLPRFHAGFSLGTVAGAALGAALARTTVSVETQLVGTAALVALAVPLATRTFLPRTREAIGSDGASRGAMAAWRERRTLVIGVLVLAFALCEGIANDWLALTLVDSYDASESVGAIGFAAFVAAMTLGRVTGGSLIDRWGRVAVLRVTAALVVAGVVAVSVGPHLAWAMVGAVLWGAGASLGFPLGMAAAGDDERESAPRVAVVSSIGYAAFLGGPPLVGFLADAVGLHRAILVAVAAAAIGILVAGAARPWAIDEAGARHEG